MQPLQMGTPDVYFKISVIYKEEQHRVSDQKEKERGIKLVGWVSEGGTMQVHTIGAEWNREIGETNKQSAETEMPRRRKKGIHEA